ncbi:hypothetical protein CEXT_194871, partial [Caerostris extrusa]
EEARQLEKQICPHSSAPPLLQPQTHVVPDSNNMRDADSVTESSCSIVV